MPKEAKLDKLSYTSIPLKILSPTGIILAVCTGFIYVKDNQHYLVTNWHNFTGKNPDTNKALKDTFVLPQMVQMPFHKTGTPFITWERVNFNLLDKSLSPRWLVHPVHKQKVDVVALKINIPKDVIIHAINQQNFDDFSPMVADNVYILGFPYNFNGGGNFPIWKMASIATEPDIDFNSKPQMLVDTASREGMSGAPVIFRRQGVHGLIGGQMMDNSIIGEIQNFVGVYSGRYTSDTQFDAQLGIVWKKSVIDEIIDGNFIDK